MKLWARQLALGLLLTAAIPPAAVRAADSADQILLEKANFWRLRDRPDLARDALDKLLAVNPMQPDALYAYGVIELQQGKALDARGYLARLRQVAPADPRVAALETALAGAPAAAAKPPKPTPVAQAPAPLPAAGMALAATDSKYRQAVAADPKNPMARLDHARFLASQGQAAQGFATVDPAASGNTPAAFYAAAVFDSEQQRPADALAKLDRVPAAQRTADMARLRAAVIVPATIQRAKMLASAGKGADARTLLAALAGDPSLAAADKDAVAATLAALGGPAPAAMADGGKASVAVLAARAKADPDDPALQAALGRAHGDAGQYKEAVEAFAAAYRLDPKNTDALAALIDAAIRGHDIKAARRYLGAAVAAYPDDARFHDLEGQLAQAEGHTRAVPSTLSGSSAAPPQAAGALNPDAGSSAPPPLAASADSTDVAAAQKAPAPAAGAPVPMASLPSSAVSDGDLTPDSPQPGGAKRVQLAQAELDVPQQVPLAAAQSWQTPPANPNAPPPEDSLPLDIERSINQIEAENSPTLEGGFVYRGRFGTAGLSQLNEIAVPFDATFAPWWTGKMTVSMSPVWLDAGRVGGSSLPLFGTNQLLAAKGLPMVTPAEQSEFGALGSIAYAYGDFSGRIGESAWGFPVTNIIGNVAYNPKFDDGQLSAKIEGYREPVTDSLLSYAGTRANLGAVNAATGNAFGTNHVWGGVTNSGVRGSLFYDDTNIGAFGIVSGGDLDGTNVAKNSEISAVIGGYFRPWRTETQAVRVGVNLNYFGFDKNLSYYTFGQGGYFSPQNYIALTFPVEWQGIQDKWSWLAAVGLGIQHFNAASSPYYPNNPAAQAQLEIAQGSSSNNTVVYPGTHSTGLAADVRGQIEYAVSKDLAVGASAQYDNGNDYNEGIVKVYFRKTFAEPPPVSPILPGTPSGGPPDNSPPPSAAAPPGVAPGAPPPATPASPGEPTPLMTSPTPASAPSTPPPAAPAKPPQSAG